MNTQSLKSWIGIIALAATLVMVPIAAAPTLAQSKGSAKKPVVDKKKKTKPAARRATTTRGAKSPSKKKTLKRGEAQRDSHGKLIISKDVQKKIDEMMTKPVKRALDPKTRQEARDRVEKRRENKRPVRKTPVVSPSKGSRPAIKRPRTPGRRSGADLGGVAIDIPPSEPGVPAQQRQYSFSIKNGSYKQLIEALARQTGLAVRGEAPVGNSVTFVTEEVLTFDELLKRVRLLLFEYKAHDPYWLLQHDTHLEVLRLADFVRDHLGPDLIYQGLEDFQRRNPPDNDLAYVLYTPKRGSLSEQEFLRDLMPDYMRFTPLEKSNTAAIFGLVRDIKKYLVYVDIFMPVTQGDPRTIELIPVHFITPTEAFDQLSELMKLDGAGKAPPTIRRPKAGSALAGVPAPQVSVIPQDAQGVLIVRAMQDKIEEIKKLLPYVDVDTNPNFTPVVVEIKHGTPEALIDTIQQILNPAVSATSVPRRPRKSGGRRVGATTGQPVSSGLTLIPHPAGHAIVVLAKDEDVARVRALITQFDIASEIGPIRIVLQHVQADAVLPTITRLIGGTSSIPRARPGKVGSASTASQVVAAASGDALWFTGSQRDLNKVRGLLVEMDVEAEPTRLHIVRLENQKPSFVAQMLHDYDSGASGLKPGARPRPGIKMPGRGTASLGGQGGPSFTPDDEQGRLFVLCTDSKWKKLLPFIQELENEATEVDFQLMTVKHISPGDAVEKLTSLVIGSVKLGPRAAPTGLRLEATSDGVLVMGASAAELATIRALLQQFDKPIEMVQRTFEIKYADPADVKEAVEALISAKPSMGRSKSKSRPRLPGKMSLGVGASTSDGLTIVQIDTRLVVKGLSDVVDEVSELIKEFDVDRTQLEMRTYVDFRLGTDLEEFADTLSTLMGTSSSKVTGLRPKLMGGSGRSPKGDAPRFIPQSTARKLIVMARPVQFPRIEQFIEVLRNQAAIEPNVVEFVSLTYADPQEVIDLIEPLLDMKVRERMGLSGSGKSRASTGVKILPQLQRNKRKRASDAAPFHLSADARNHRIIVSATQVIVDDAKLLIAQFDIPLDSAVAKQVEFIDVQHADPEVLIEAIEPILEMKIEELVKQGELPDGHKVGRATASPQPRSVLKLRGDKDSSKRFHMYGDLRQNRIVIIAAPVIIGVAHELIAAFDLPGSGAEMPVVEIVPIEHGVPSVIVEQIDPLLSLEVSAMESGGGSRDSKSMSSKPAVQRLQKMARPKDKSRLNYHLEPDDANKQIVIAAPPSVVERAKTLIALFDKPSSDEIVFETIVLTNANPVEMVEAISGLMSGSSGAKTKRPKVRKPGQPTAIPRPVTDGSFSAVVAPGGSALVLQGTKHDVEQAKLWIARLDDMAVPGVVIKLYEIKRAPMETLVELIMHQVNTSQNGSTALAGNKRPASGNKADDEEDAFTTTITRTSGDVYLRADLIDHTIIVSAPPAIIVRIDAVVARVDPSDSDSPLIDDDTPRVPKLVYKLKYTDAYDASEELDLVLEAMWEPANEKPTVDWASFGNLLIVRYPYKERFAEIEELIAEYVDKPKVKKIKKVVLTPPAGASPKEFAEWIRRFNTGLDIEIVDVTTDRGETYGVTELHPAKQLAKVNRCVLPSSLIAAAKILAESVPAQGKSKREKKHTPKQSLDDAIRQKGQELVDKSKDNKKSDDKKTTSVSSQDKPLRAGEKLKIFIDETTGAITLEGPESVINDVPEWIEDFGDQRKDAPPPPPDIRHFRLRYIDVYSAAEIIEQMFNATRQQRQSVQRAQQQAARQRQQQQQQQQQRQRDSQQKGDQPNRQNQQRGKQTQVSPIPQLPPSTVRIQPHPRDRTLIIRADATQFPAIMKLIATIDQPKPIDRVHRIYQLQHLEAVEVEELLRDWLGLDAPARKKQVSSNQGRAGRTRSVGGAKLQVGPQLPETIMEHAVTGDDLLGVDPVDISLSSNSASNSILAMAPKAALDYIGKLITDIDVPNTAMDYKSITLAHADAKVVADTLSAMFAGSRSSSGKNKKGSSSPFAFLGNEDEKIVFYRAPERLREKILEVVSQIEEQSKARTTIHVVKLEYATPSQVAEAIESAYSKPGGGKKGRSKTVSVTPIDSTKQLFISADDATYEEIESLVQSLDLETSIGFDFRIFPLQYAEARKVHKTMMKLMADFIGRLPREQQEALEAFSAEVDDTANALIVLGGPVIFGFIEDALKRIDIPAAQRGKLSTLMVPIKNGDADEISQSINRLYASKGDTEEIPPQADANKALNILIVRGTAEQLDEIQTQFIDPLDKHSAEQLMTATLAVTHIRADEAADIITQMFDDRLRAVEQASGSRKPSVSPIETTVVVTPDISTNQIIVQASKTNLETIKQRLVLLDTPDVAKRNAVTTKVYALKVADPNTVVQMVKEWSQRSQSGSKKGQQMPKRDMILAISDSETNSVVVTASEPNHDRIGEMIASLDDESIVESRQKIQNIVLKYADPGVVQEAIVQLFGSARGKKEPINAVADWNSRSVTVSAPSADLERIESLIAQIDTEGAADSNVHVVRLDNADAESVSQTIDEIFVQSAPSPQGNQPPAISVAAVLGTPALLVKSSKSDFERIRSVIDQLDSKELTLKEPVRLISVSLGVDVIDLAQKLESSMNDSLRYASGQKQGRQPSISIQADKRTRTLIVGGSPAYFDQVEKMARAYEELAPKSGETVRIIRLGQAPANEITRMIDQLKGGDSRSGSSRRGGSARRSGSSRQGGSSARRGSNQRSGGNANRGRTNNRSGGGRRPTSNRQNR